jgi:hypothetical protein
MNGNRLTFVHSLLFQCQACKQPLSLCIMSTDRNSENIDGNSFELLCVCGWTKTLLGMQARRHWVAAWVDEDEEPEAGASFQPGMRV